ncbi:MAG: hypothetical protein WC877_00780 [Dehalococcoidales bacterium]|jgi:DNA ligase-1
MIKKPMLSVNAELDKIRYPVLGTPKIDGIRCLTTDLGAVSRNMKPIPNAHVRNMLNDLPVGLDGELIVDNNFHQTSSGIMSRDGEPKFTYKVFDYIIDGDTTMPYNERMTHLFEFAMEVEPDPHLSGFIQCLLPIEIQTQSELFDYEGVCHELGYEGCMIRKVDSPYKSGRSSVKEGYLLKIKRFEDAEAEIIGFEELQRNQNAAKRDVFGHIDRSTCKDGMVAGQTMGAIRVRDLKTGVEFSIGSGFTASDRETIWSHQDFYIGKAISYKFQPCGTKDAPRFPIFKGFRHPNDIS